MCILHSRSEACFLQFRFFLAILSVTDFSRTCFFTLTSDIALKFRCETGASHIYTQDIVPNHVYFRNNTILIDSMLLLLYACIPEILYIATYIKNQMYIYIDIGKVTLRCSQFDIHDCYHNEVCLFTNTHVIPLLILHLLF
jgi:hypothetical protein